MKSISAVFVVLVLMLTGGRKYPDGWQYIPLSKNDEFATNRFGHSWLEPVYNGYLIVGDRYIDAPYVVEQRGFVIFVNNERIEDGTDIRLVSPLPPEEPVIVDPGVLTNLSRVSNLDDVFYNPVYIQKGKYWDGLGVYGDKRFELELGFLRSFPCISNVVDLNEASFAGRNVRVYDYNGNNWLVALPTGPRPPMQTSNDPKMYGDIVGTLGGRRQDLNESCVFYVRNGSQPGASGAVWDTNKWMEVFKTLADDLTPSQRLDRIRTVEAFSPNSDHHIMTMLPMNGFKPTTQLWQRLSGEMSWTNDGPTRMFALTNGWQKILPAFMRTQTVAVATMPSIPSDKTGTIATQQPKKHNKPIPKGSSPATATQESDDIQMSSSSITWWFIGCTALVVIGLVVLWRHLAKKG